MSRWMRRAAGYTLVALILGAWLVPRLKAQQYAFQVFDLDSGLSNLAVESTYQDQEGLNSSQ